MLHPRLEKCTKDSDIQYKNPHKNYQEHPNQNT